MPVKRRKGKLRSIMGLDDARILFRKNGGFEITPSGSGIFTSEALAVAYGCLPLIAYANPHEILDNLQGENDVS